MQDIMRETILSAGPPRVAPLETANALADKAPGLGKPFYYELHNQVRVLGALGVLDSRIMDYLRAELKLTAPLGAAPIQRTVPPEEINQTVEALAKLSPTDFAAKYTAAQVAAVAHAGGAGVWFPVAPVVDLTTAHQKFYDYNQHETSKLMAAWNKRQAKVNLLQEKLNYMRAHSHAATNNLPLPTNPPVAIAPPQGNVNGVQTYSSQQIQDIEDQLKQAKKFEKINGPLGGYWMRSKKMSWGLNLTVIRPIKLHYILLGVKKLI